MSLTPASLAANAGAPQLVSLSAAPGVAGAVSVGVQPTFVTLAPGQQLVQHNPPPSAVLAGTLVQKPPGMAALAAPHHSVVTLQQPQTPTKPQIQPPPQHQPTQQAPQQPQQQQQQIQSQQSQSSQSQPSQPQQSQQQQRAQATGVTTSSNEVLTKQRLHELVKEIDPNEQLDEEVEELLLQLADDFIENTVSTACQLAKHRKAATVDVKDVQLYLERKWNMWIPGFGTEEVRPYKRSSTTEAHKQRMAIIRKALKKY